MKCKYCLAEIGEDVTVCPVCGKDLNEAEETSVVNEAETVAEEAATPKEKRKVWKIVLAAAGIAVLALVLTCVILHSMGVNLKFWRANDLYYRQSYTKSDEAVEKNTETVIATVGNQVLTNGELQVYYWMEMYAFAESMRTYGYNLSAIGLDLSVPFDEQIFDEKTGKTYQQLFLENALNTWHGYAVLMQMAEEEGFALNAEQQAELNSMKEQIQSLAAKSGYTDLELFIDKEFCPGSSLGSYLKYNTTLYTALTYYDTLYASQEPTDAEVEAYYAANETELTQKGYGKDKGDYYDVRHILIPVEGVPTYEAGKSVYTEEDWEKCKNTVQILLDDFLKEPSEEAFASLAGELSEDPGSSSKGGLYSKLTKDTNFIKGFKDWYLEEGRKPGDTGLVKNTESSVQGYHIMYFSGKTPIWQTEAKAALQAERVTGKLDEAKGQLAIDVNYKKISLAYMDPTAS